MPMCVMCASGLPSSCLGISCDSSLPSPVTESDPSLTLEVSDDSDDDVRGRGTRATSSRNSGGRDANLKDQQSTGRKRAARLYPLSFESPCEWVNRSNCGGGTHPIRGCVSGTQQARHHGPDKSVVNNEEGNVHRICHYCHNRWHVANDATYDWNAGYYNPHNPRPMTEAETKSAIMDEMRYQTTKSKKIKD